MREAPSTWQLRFTTSTDVPWLRASPTEGISDATNDRERIIVSTEIDGLQPGIYIGNIIVSARRATNDPQSAPVTLVISAAPEPGVISRVRFLVINSEALEIFTPDNQVQVTIPQGTLPNEEADFELEVKNIDVGFVPNPPDDVMFVRAVELNTLVDGAVSPMDYGRA